MDFVSMSLITMAAPSNVWATILNWFRGANGTYILAVILVAIVVRFLFSFVDIINKRANLKNSEITQKMQPELDALQKKYGNDKNVLQQKTSDVYKKYQYNMMGSCLPMLIMMVLQLVVFFTLWSSLQSMSNYNIASQYQEMKEIYANVLALNDETVVQTNFTDGDTIVAEVTYDENGNKYISYTIESGTDAGATITDKKLWTENLTNDAISKLIDTHILNKTEEETNTQVIASEEGTQTALQIAVQAAAEAAAKNYYYETQESFLWIKNVYKSDTNTSPLFTQSEIVDLMKSYYDEADGEAEVASAYEEEIFQYVVAGIDTDELGANGYYILPILAVLSSLFSIWLNNFLNRRKGDPKKKQSWAMYVIMPVIYGIFTFSYTSLFSIYLIIGQLIMIIMAPLTTWIVRKWIASDDKKKKEKDVIEVDYRRKDI